MVLDRATSLCEAHDMPISYVHVYRHVAARGDTWSMSLRFPASTPTEDVERISRFRYLVLVPTMEALVALLKVGEL